MLVGSYEVFSRFTSGNVLTSDIGLPIIRRMWKSLITDILRSGMTQTEVAKAIGISQASVSDIYRGVVSDPKASIADAIRLLHSNRGPPPAKKAA